ncbi:MAG: ABC transporter permease [Candidatus Aminicenantaceae bacterium]
MLKNHLKIAFRNIKKHKTFSAINIVGLAVGITCSILIWLFVSHERSYDRFHEKADRIFRLALRATLGDTKIDQTQTSSEVFRRLAAEFPEIEKGVKFYNPRRTPVIFENRTFYESRLYAVDAPFFEVFTFPLIGGDPQTALAEPNSMVLSKATAEKYFGTTDVLGNTIRADFSNSTGSAIFHVTGVSENVPDNSHFHFDILVSSSTFPGLINEKDWGEADFITYLLLTPGTSKDRFDEKLKEFTRRNLGGRGFDEWVAEGNYWEYFLQPITEIHLNSDLKGEFEANGNRTYIVIFSVISIIILLIACINFMNLSTAKSSIRAKEVGVRKVVGSSRKELMQQFLSESILLSFISLALGLAAIQILLPAYRNFVGRNLSMPYLDNAAVIPSLLALGLVVGLISGSYPAFFLSSFPPISVFRGFTGRSSGSSLLRNILVVFQFAIAIFLIAGTLVVFQQLKFFQNKRLGFEKEQVLVVRNPGSLGNSVSSFKDALRQNSHVSNVSGSNTLPSRSYRNMIFISKDVANKFNLNLCVCDFDFLETLKLEMADGRFFSREFSTDTQAVILNERAVNALGWEDPIGKNFWSPGVGKLSVIGVIKDYHYESLHQEIRPLALLLAAGNLQNEQNYISVRLSTESVFGTVRHIENTWKTFAPGNPFEYSFLDQDYDNLYTNEKQIRSLFSVFSFLAIFISCLGLFGLASFVADLKTKEIGVRKVLGATVPNIVLHLTKGFTKGIVLANIIAWPLAYFAMNGWLQQFAYRIGIGLWVFALSGILALGIAFFTVSYHTIKAATANPVDSLRYE